MQLYRYFVSQSSQFSAITLCVASQQVFIIVYFVIDSVIARESESNEPQAYLQTIRAGLQLQKRKQIKTFVIGGEKLFRARLHASGTGRDSVNSYI
jgi:hypothetical protein